MTRVRCKGEGLTVGIAVDSVNGMVFRIDRLPGEDAKQLQASLEPILDAVDADVVVSSVKHKPDRDSRKESAESLFFHYT